MRGGYSRLSTGSGGSTSTSTITLIITCVVSTFVATVLLMNTRQLFSTTGSTTTTSLTSTTGSLRQKYLKQPPPTADPFNYVDHSLYSNFHHELIVPEVNEDWVSLASEQSHKYFTQEELDSMMDHGRGGTCDTEKLPEHCCLGAFSMAGMMKWNALACPAADFMKFPVPHDDRVGVTTYQSIGDLIDLLGEGKTVTFVGDSVTSQHAHAMECAWLRTQAGRTSHFSRVDYDRIFQKNGMFNPDSQYGINAVTTWEVEVPPNIERGETEPTKNKFIFYLMYRPSIDDLIKIAEESDVMVVNFGLHYLMSEKKLLRQEATEMFKVLKEFASTPGRTLIWREVSAQFHLGEGGEWPSSRLGLGLTEAEFNETRNQCHPLVFGRRIPPQWRDRIYLSVVKELGFDLSLLGSYDRSKEPEASIQRRPRHLQDTNTTTTTTMTNDTTPTSSSTDTNTTTAAAGTGNTTSSEVVKSRREDSWLFHKDRVRVSPVLYWLPFFRLSSETLHLRPYNQARNSYDCTHFCFTPYMWEPMVDGMATALRRQMAQPAPTPAP